MDLGISFSLQRVRPATCLFSASLLGATVTAAPLTAQRIAQKDPLVGDARLGQHVTVSTQGVALDELIALIGKRTGLSLTASPEVSDDKVIMFGPARPLRDILSDLAVLFNDRWERRQRAGSKVQYVLTRDARARQLETRLAQSRQARLLARLGEYVRALSESPDVLMRRPVGDPIRECLSQPERRLGLALFGLLSAAQREELFRRRRLAISFGALTPDQQGPLRQLFAETLERWKAHSEPGSTAGHLTSRMPEPADLERGSLQFQWRQLLGQTNLQLQLGRFPILVEAFFADFTWLLPSRANPYTGDPVPDDAALPPLRVVQVATAERTWPDRLRTLVRNTEFSVMADFYRSRPIARTMDGGGASPDTPRAALDLLCRSPGYLWWIRGKTLLLRKRDWFSQKQRELPDRWVVALMNRLKRQEGVPTRSDVLGVLELSLAQIAAMNDQVSPEDESDLQGLQELLAIVAASPSGVALRLPGGGSLPLQRTVLSPDQMTPRQRSLLPAYLAAMGQASPDSTEGVRVEMWCPRDGPETAASGYRYVAVGVRGDAGSYSLYLPITLVDDRRATTRVEVVS